MSQNSHLHTRVSCRTRGLTASLFFCRTAHHLYTIFPTGVTLASRNGESRLVVWPNRARSQVVSPAILWRLAVRRSRLCSHPWEKQALVRLTTLARTSPPRLRRRKWKKDQLEKVGFTAVNTGRETSAAPIQDLSLQQRKLWVTFITRSNRYGKTRGDVLAQEKVKSRFRCFAAVFFRERENPHWAPRNPRCPWIASRSCRLRRKTALSKPSEVEYHTRLLLEERKNRTLS